MCASTQIVEPVVSCKLPRQPLDQLVVSALLVSEYDLRPVGQYRSPDKSWFADHQLDEFIVGSLAFSIPVRLRTGTLPGEHFFHRREFTETFDFIKRQLLFEEIAKLVLDTRIIESPTGFLTRTST